VAYRFKSGEPVPEGIKRIVGEEIEAAARHLSGQGVADRDEAIHEARKSIKKIRGVLRLMRGELGDIYRTENAHFGDIGRELSQFRDAGASIETFDALRKRYRGEMDGRTLASIRRRLKASKRQAEQQAGIATVLTGMAAALRQLAPSVSRWPLAKDGFAAIAPGLTATFRRGRKALERARTCESSENYHEWRKRVKEHWYHVRLLESFWSSATEAYEKSLKELETALGEDHNLVLLQEKIEAEPVFYGKPPEIALLIELIERYHKELRGKALHLGKSIYEEKPGQFTRHMRSLWDARKTVSMSGRSAGPAA
jgi:CHAD domain-containing protein